MPHLFVPLGYTTTWSSGCLQHVAELVSQLFGCAPRVDAVVASSTSRVDAQECSEPACDDEQDPLLFLRQCNFRLHRTFGGALSGAILQEAALHQVPQVATEPAPGESLAPRRTHRCGEKGLGQAAVVATFAALGLRGQSRMDAETVVMYNIELLYRKHLCTITVAFVKTTILSHASLCRRRSTSRDRNFATSICAPNRRSVCQASSLIILECQWPQPQACEGNVIVSPNLVAVNLHTHSRKLAKET